jgi:hypothetical protein
LREGAPAEGKSKTEPKVEFSQGFLDHGYKHMPAVNPAEGA